MCTWARKLVISTLCALFACTCASAQMVERVDLVSNHISTIAAFRDLRSSGRYYFIPLRLAFDQSQNRSAIGIQYFDSPQGSGKSIVFTLSVMLSGSTEELARLPSALNRPGEAVSLSPLMFHYRLSYFYRLRAEKAVRKSTISEGDYVAGSAVSATFQLDTTKQNAKELLSGEAPNFGLLMEISPGPTFGITRSFSIHGDKIASVLKSIGYLPANGVADPLRLVMLSGVFQSEIIPWGVGEEAMVREWLSTILGDADLNVDANGRSIYGWNLSTDRIQDQLKGKTVDLRSVLPTSEHTRFGLTFDFDDLCSNHSESIIDLDQSASGCGGLK